MVTRSNCWEWIWFGKWQKQVLDVDMMHRHSQLLDTYLVGEWEEHVQIYYCRYGQE